MLSAIRSHGLHALFGLALLIAIVSGVVASRQEPPPEPTAPVRVVHRLAPSSELRPPVASDLPTYLDRLPPGEMKVDIALPRATIETSLGTLHCWLNPATPLATANFIGLASGQKAWRDPATGQIVQRPFYDGLTLHRVIPGFVIQGGDPTGTSSGGPGYTFADEIIPGAHFGPGMLAMANAGRDTNGSQFFITEGSPQWIDGHFTIFGQCLELDVVKRIARVATTTMDRPIEPVVIRHVTLTRF